LTGTVYLRDQDYSIFFLHVFNYLFLALISVHIYFHSRVTGTGDLQTSLVRPLDFLDRSDASDDLVRRHRSSSVKFHSRCRSEK
jgi:hypothetical protein